MHDVYDAILLPGIKVETTDTNFHPVKALQLEKCTGTIWQMFGEFIEGSGW